MSEIILKRFASFESDAELEMFQGLLEENEIHHQVEEIPPQPDSVFGGPPSKEKYRVHVDASQFERVSEILDQKAREMVVSVPEDHYLLEFTDEELFDILKKPDEWSRQDHLLAMLILKERGQEVTKEEVEQWMEERVEFLNQPIKGRKGSLVLGYIFSFMGGLLGVLIGWYHWKGSKKAADGSREAMFDADTRKQGKQIFWLGIAAIVLWPVILIFTL